VKIRLYYVFCAILQVMGKNYAANLNLKFPDTQISSLYLVLAFSFQFELIVLFSLSAAAECKSNVTQC